MATARPCRGVGFKREPPDYEMYNPASPIYNDDDLEDTHVRDKKKFRCPFNREKDGNACNKHDDNKNEVLNHFYKYHFARISSGNVFEENLNCFFNKCHDTFSTHEKLVKHVHKHEAGKESLFYIKYLIENFEGEKKEALDELKAVFKAEKMDVENLLEECKKEKEMLIEKHLSSIEDMETDTKEKENKLTDDLRYYRKKCDATKKKSEDDLKTLKEKESKIIELKNKNETLSRELSSNKIASEETEIKLKGKISDLKERNAELRGKFSIQQETSQELSNKLEKFNRKWSDLGPNSESSLVKRNARLEKQLEMAKKQIKAKEAELKEKDEQIFKLTFEDSEDESNKPSNSNLPDGEYVEED